MGDWSRQRADRWWKLHLPELAGSTDTPPGEPADPDPTASAPVTRVLSPKK